MTGLRVVWLVLCRGVSPLIPARQDYLHKIGTLPFLLKQVISHFFGFYWSCVSNLLHDAATLYKVTCDWTTEGRTVELLIVHQSLVQTSKCLEDLNCSLAEVDCCAEINTLLPWGGFSEFYHRFPAAFTSRPGWFFSWTCWKPVSSIMYYLVRVSVDVDFLVTFNISMHLNPDFFALTLTIFHSFWPVFCGGQTKDGDVQLDCMNKGFQPCLNFKHHLYAWLCVWGGAVVKGRDRGCTYRWLFDELTEMRPSTLREGALTPHNRLMNTPTSPSSERRSQQQTFLLLFLFIKAYLFYERSH